MSEASAEILKDSYGAIGRFVSTYIEQRSKNLIKSGLAEYVARGQATIEGIIETLEPNEYRQQLMAAEAARNGIVGDEALAAYYEKRTAELADGANYLRKRLATEGASYSAKAYEPTGSVLAKGIAEAGGAAIDIAQLATNLVLKGVRATEGADRRDYH